MNMNKNIHCNARITSHCLSRLIRCIVKHSCNKLETETGNPVFTKTKKPGNLEFFKPKIPFLSAYKPV